jgi:hypothetical protein
MIVRYDFCNRRRLTQIPRTSSMVTMEGSCPYARSIFPAARLPRMKTITHAGSKIAVCEKYGMRYTSIPTNVPTVPEANGAYPENKPDAKIVMRGDTACGECDSEGLALVGLSCFGGSVIRYK